MNVRVFRALFSWRLSAILLSLASLLNLCITDAFGQTAFPEDKVSKVDAKDVERLETRRKALEKAVAEFAAQAEKSGKKLDPQWLADIEVLAKGVEWLVRHNEFFRPNYVALGEQSLALGEGRLSELKAGRRPWENRAGTTIVGYVSQVDGSRQPYALTLPEGFQPDAPKRWPLHVKLHGRGANLNEVAFVKQHEGKKAAKGLEHIEIDVFGRTNNAYRFAGETDVFEAIADAKRRCRIDERRVTLRGFSMGGAGAWHLGLHYPSLWSSVGPGAGFVDFYDYQKVTKKLPFYQHQTLSIYDATDYAMNAFNVPICTYGGELDAQLVASTKMAAKAKTAGAEIKVIIGPKTAHRWHPESEKEFLAFHAAKSKEGRVGYPGLKHIRFITHTLKYNECEWLTIEEMLELYKPAIVEGKVGNDGILRIKTRNVAVLQIARDVTDSVEIDGTLMKLNSAADGLLPGVYYEKGKESWHVQDYETSRSFVSNPDLRKRRNLQGPIDDAFMQPFLCVRGTGKPWVEEQDAWAKWTLGRFEQEFDKWMRGKIHAVDDSKLTEEQIKDHNIILFGDPGSNSVLAKILDRLPVKWTREAIEVNGVKYDPKSHGLSLIYPNPLNKSRYVVINSGHTFHERDFRASNAWLFPRLGDIAVQKFEKLPGKKPGESGAGYKETIVWADLFNPSWRLIPADVPRD